MNERIRELFEKHTVPNFGADADTVRNQKGEYRTPMIEDHWQTFQEAAELLVRECASVIAEHYDASEPWITPKTLLYHFGVEE
jgi:hypothetical protein